MCTFFMAKTTFDFHKEQIRQLSLFQLLNLPCVNVRLAIQRSLNVSNRAEKHDNILFAL